MRILLKIILIAILFQGCHSSAYLFKKEKYKQLVQKNLKKGMNGRLSQEEIGYFIDGFNAWYYEKETVLNHKYQSNSYKDWIKALREIHKIEVIQNQTAAFPQIDSSALKYTSIDHWKAQFKDQLYAHHLRRYTSLVEDYKRTDNRQFVKMAYDEVRSLEAFSIRPNREAHAAKRAECLALGHRYFHVQYDKSTWVSSNDYHYFVNSFEFISDDWNTFLENDDAPSLDYRILIELSQCDSDESTSCSSDTYSEEIIARYETKKDTSGKIIKTPIYETITATVTTTEYQYEVNSRANIQIENLRQDPPQIDSESFFYCTTDECETIATSGDARALPSYISCRTCSLFYDYSDLERESIQSLARRIEDVVINL